MLELLGFSPEIIIAIARQLLPEQDRRNPVYHEIEGQEARINRTSLNHLSQTCKTLQRLVQPILYRCAYTQGDACVSLVRTICLRPDLGQAIREIHIGGWGFNPGCEVPAADRPLFERLFTNYTKDFNGNAISVSPYWYKNSPVAWSLNDRETHFAGKPDVALAALVLTKIPYVERIKLWSYYDGDYPFFQPNSMLRLQYLGLSHGDTEGGVDLSTVKGICMAAPNLEQLNGFALDNISEPIPHKRLEKLVIRYSLITAKEFPTLLSGFDNLQSFEYDCGGSMI